MAGSSAGSGSRSWHWLCGRAVLGLLAHSRSSSTGLILESCSVRKHRKPCLLCVCSVVFSTLAAAVLVRRVTRCELMSL